MTLSGDSLNKIDKPHLLREFLGNEMINMQLPKQPP